MPLAYDIVRYAGAAYLIYLGVHALTHAAPMGQLVYLKPTPIKTFQPTISMVLTML